MILRVNRRHHSRDAYLQLLIEAGIEAQPCTFSQDGIVLAEACDVRRASVCESAVRPRWH